VLGYVQEWRAIANNEWLILVAAEAMLYLGAFWTAGPCSGALRADL